MNFSDLKKDELVLLCEELHRRYGIGESFVEFIRQRAIEARHFNLMQQHDKQWSEALGRGDFDAARRHLKLSTHHSGLWAKMMQK